MSSSVSWMIGFGVPLLLLILLLIIRFSLFHSFRDMLHYWTDRRYEFIHILHRKYARVREGKQSYSQFCSAMQTIYAPKRYNKNSSEYENGLLEQARLLIFDMMQDESFFSEYMDLDYISYQDWDIMRTEWETSPKSDNNNVKSVRSKKLFILNNPSESEAYAMNYIQNHHERWEHACLFWALYYEKRITLNRALFNSYFHERLPESFPKDPRSIQLAVQSVASETRDNNKSCKLEIERIRKELNEVSQGFAK